MKKQLYLLVAFMLIFLVACTAEEIDLSPAPGAAPFATPPALDTLPSEAQDETSEAPVTPVPQTLETGQEGEEVLMPGAATSSAAPAEVDLSQITPEPPGNSTPQVAPRPGVPDLGAATAHTVSQDLAQRLGLDVSEISTAGVESVEWSDSSLGCPAPGMSYLTVITPGFKIALEASGKPYTYHTDLEGNFVLCAEDGQPFNP
jgi:hypothetical protein